MWQKFAYFFWSWGTTFAFAGLIYWIATIPYFSTSVGPNDDLIKVVFRLFLYAVFFILIYRSIMTTLKNTVNRLGAWRSKGELEEDAEFMLIIETFVVIVTLLATILFSVYEEYIQNFVVGRQAELRDVLVSTMAALLAAILVYTMPVLGELEVALHHKIKKEYRLLRGEEKDKSKSSKSKK